MYGFQNLIINFRSREYTKITKNNAGTNQDGRVNSNMAQSKNGLIKRVLNDRGEP